MSCVARPVLCFCGRVLKWWRFLPLAQRVATAAVARAELRRRAGLPTESGAHTLLSAFTGAGVQHVCCRGVMASYIERREDHTTAWKREGQGPVVHLPRVPRSVAHLTCMVPGTTPHPLDQPLPRAAPPHPIDAATMRRDAAVIAGIAASSGQPCAVPVNAATGSSPEVAPATPTVSFQ
jgi:hypothetical protein